MVVAIGKPGLCAAGNDPLRHHVPQLELLFDPALDRITRHHAAQHLVGRGQVVPVTLLQGFDVFKKLRAAGKQ